MMALHGVIPVFKPKGYTSHDIVGKIRRLTGQKKVGHTGTLDPEVEGVLPICLGQATRIAEYVQSFPKRYQGSMMLGISTDTQDQTGQIVEQIPVRNVSEKAIQQVFERFQGVIEQTPPMYSAVKVKGKRLYELARLGKEIDRPKRKVTIYELTYTQIHNDEEYLKIDFDVQCSKGTYIRTLCVDIGLALGYPAHMMSLVRINSGPFHIDDCFTLKELQTVAENGTWETVLYSIDEVLGQFPSLIVSDEDERRVLDGWFLELEPPMISSLVRIYTESGRFFAHYRCDK
jgi:tRNA pseudouridine55 synthase